MATALIGLFSTDFCGFVFCGVCEFCCVGGCVDILGACLLVSGVEVACGGLGRGVGCLDWVWVSVVWMVGGVPGVNGVFCFLVGVCGSVFSSVSGGVVSSLSVGVAGSSIVSSCSDGVSDVFSCSGGVVVVSSSSVMMVGCVISVLGCVLLVVGCVVSVLCCVLLVVGCVISVLGCEVLVVGCVVVVVSVVGKGGILRGGPLKKDGGNVICGRLLCFRPSCTYCRKVALLPFAREYAICVSVVIFAVMCGFVAVVAVCLFAVVVAYVSFWLLGGWVGVGRRGGRLLGLG